MSNFIKKEWLFLILVIIPCIIGILVYPHLPEQVPTHWNIQGEIDGYSSREFGAFGLPVMNLGMYILFLFVPYLDPKKNNYEKFNSTYRFLRFVTHIFMIALYFLIISVALDHQVDINLWVPAGVSILFIALGNVLGRVRHNYFVGFKMPWTLASEEVWRKTHQIGSKLMVTGGVFGLIGVFLTDGTARFIVLMSAIIIPSIITTIYSYWYFKKINKTKNE